MKSWGRIALLVALAASAAPAARASDLWLHIRVAETGAHPTTVKVNVPFSLVQRAAPLIEDARIDDGEIAWNGDHVEIAELRETWRALRSGSNRVTKDGVTWELTGKGASEALVVRETKGSGAVEMRIPAALVDALLADGRQLDLVAAVDAISRLGSGELVAVDEDGTRVRIWVDRTPEAE
ncbi:MAG: hypothetical protein NDJ92_00475 [Thermoanaerobaculia bacterium]|nr:hypothetical protein [Thermoanaerobaculia bacterium]